MPLGPLRSERYGQHVVVRSDPSGSYGKFHINDILGRIECASEPTLIYRKAELSAYTSSVVPDRLTKRTGMEEALDWLSSGTCQPWMPLSLPSQSILLSIARLTPLRTYYPESLKVMKTEKWNDGLTDTIQYDGYKDIVGEIMAKSEQLLQFYPPPTASLPGGEEMRLPVGNAHLTLRARLCRQPLYRNQRGVMELPQASDGTYLARDRSSSSNMAYVNVLEMVNLIRTSPVAIRTEPSLARSLSQCATVGGYSKPFDKALLSDRLNVDIRSEWGSLVRFSREHGNDIYAMMFLFAPMSFRFDADMALLRTVVAFGVFDELRKMELPQWPNYDHFQPDQHVNLDYLVQLMKPFRVPAPEDHRHMIKEFLRKKDLRKMREEKTRHEEESEEDCRRLGRHLLDQWPCPEPSVVGLSKPLLLDTAKAYEAIRPEWLRLFQNIQLSGHLRLVHGILEPRQSDIAYKPPDFVPSVMTLPCRVPGGEIPELTGDLMKGSTSTARSSARSPVSSPGHRRNSSFQTRSLTGGGGVRSAANYQSPMQGPSKGPPTQAPEIEELRNIIRELKNTRSTVRRLYAEELEQSLSSFARQDESGHREWNQRGGQMVEDARKVIAEVRRRYDEIKAILDCPSSRFLDRHIWWLQHGLLWPIITPSSILAHLRSTDHCEFGSGMKDAVIQYGLAITRLQRRLRLNELATKGNAISFKAENDNPGHANWRPEEYPDWLLLEIEANLLIRPDQVDVALATISPASGMNSVLQMNMGQGKHLD